MLATGGGGVKKNFPVVPYQNCTFLTKFFLKTWKFPNKKGTFYVNLVFTATLACTKRELFVTKKGTFSPLKKFGGGTCLACPPGSYAPVPQSLVSRFPKQAVAHLIGGFRGTYNFKSLSREDAKVQPSVTDVNVKVALSPQLF
jgi:hypothetical protein